MTDVATLDALMAQPFAVGVRREQMARVWEAFMQDALDWTHANAARFIIGPERAVPLSVRNADLLPPYVDLFNAALDRILAADKALEEEGRRLAQWRINAGDAKWRDITANASGLRRGSLT